MYGVFYPVAYLWTSWTYIVPFLDPEKKEEKRLTQAFCQLGPQALLLLLSQRPIHRSCWEGEAPHHCQLCPVTVVQTDSIQVLLQSEEVFPLVEDLW